MWWAAAARGGSTPAWARRRGAAWFAAAAAGLVAPSCCTVALADAPAAAATAAAARPVHSSPGGAATKQPQQPQQQQPQRFGEGTHWRIFTSTGEPASLGQVVAAITQQADVCLLGEVHDDPVAHALQLALLRRAAAALGYGGASHSQPAAASTASPPPPPPAAAGAAAAGAAAAQPQGQPAPSSRRPLLLSLEQFETDVQPVLDEFMAGCIPLADLLKDARPWANYLTDYHQLVACCKALGLPPGAVVAANAPRRYVSLAGRAGSAALARLPEAARAWLPPLPHAPPSAAYVSKVDGSMRQAAEEMARLREQRTAATAAGSDHHGADASEHVAPPSSSASSTAAAAAAGAAAAGAAPPQAAPAASEQAGCPHIGLNTTSNFMAAQSLWDATMAFSISRALSAAAAAHSRQQPASAAASGTPPDPGPLVMHVCGKFHCEHRLGIPEHLAAGYAPSARTIVVVMVPWSDDLASVGPTQLAAAGLTSSSGGGGSGGSANEAAAGDFIVLTSARVPRSFESVHPV